MTPGTLATPPRRSALITADDSQQSLNIGTHAAPDAWMWAPVTDEQQGDWRRGYGTWDAVFAAAGTWLAGGAS